MDLPYQPQASLAVANQRVAWRRSSRQRPEQGVKLLGEAWRERLS